jgi:hypothetical protein
VSVPKPKPNATLRLVLVLVRSYRNGLMRFVLKKR